jgi:hypothetical protein
MFKRFVKKPVVIEAVQWTGENRGEIAMFAMNHCVFNSEELIIKTLEGAYKANVGDWIIKGIAGEFYPCKPDIFEVTYDELYT